MQHVISYILLKTLFASRSDFAHKFVCACLEKRVQDNIETDGQCYLLKEEWG